MTDNDIIYILEICVNKSEVFVSYHNEETGEYDKVTIKDILGVINRQKAEIEKWQGGYMTQKQEIANLEIELKAMRGAANSYKAESERLEKECKITRAYLHDNGLEWDLLSYSTRKGDDEGE